MMPGYIASVSISVTVTVITVNYSFGSSFGYDRNRKMWYRSVAKLNFTRRYIEYHDISVLSVETN